MEIPAIHLKFSSLSKNRSKCCLEIIPEVSNTHNLDKIKWRENIDAIEYVVPVTYKIILKKLDSFRDYNQNELKNYHSCIDFIPSSTLSNSHLAYGDIGKHISDYLIHRHNCNKTNPHVSVTKPIILSRIEIDKEFMTLERKTTLHIGQNTEIKNSDEISHKINVSKSIGVSVRENFNTIKNSNIESQAEKGIRHTKNTSTLTDKNFVQHSCNDRKNLSIAPVCKIDTCEEIVYRQPPQTMMFLKPVIQYSQHFTKPNPQIYKLFRKDELNESQNFPVLSLNSDKILHPSARIAYYKSVMEKEIFPLKVILQELISKCVNFGLLGSTVDSRENTKNITNCIDNANRICKNEIQCNRVVYSIVFDE